MKEHDVVFDVPAYYDTVVAAFPGLGPVCTRVREAEGDDWLYPLLWYVVIESLLRDLADRLAPLDVSEVRNFVRLNEFGMAFDFLIGSIQQSAALTSREVDVLDTLAEALDEHGHWNVVRGGARREGD